jgi:hypothetical protein
VSLNARAGQELLYATSGAYYIASTINCLVLASRAVCSHRPQDGSGTCGGRRPQRLLPGIQCLLVNRPEETVAPPTAMAGKWIAFMIGPEPHETIPIADASDGRISGRVCPGNGAFDSIVASPDGTTFYFTKRFAPYRIAQFLSSNTKSHEH